jgi:hypothetical protein
MRIKFNDPEIDAKYEEALKAADAECDAVQDKAYKVHWKASDEAYHAARIAQDRKDGK